MNRCPRSAKSSAKGTNARPKNFWHCPHTIRPLVFACPLFHEPKKCKITGREYRCYTNSNWCQCWKLAIGSSLPSVLYLFRCIIGVLADIGGASRAPIGFFNRGLTIEHYSTDMMIKADRHSCVKSNTVIRTQSALVRHSASWFVVDCRRQTRCSWACNQRDSTHRCPASFPVVQLYHPTFNTTYHR